MVSESRDIPQTSYSEAEHNRAFFNRLMRLQPPPTAARPAQQPHQQQQQHHAAALASGEQQGYYTIQGGRPAAVMGAEDPRRHAIAAQQQRDAEILRIRQHEHQQYMLAAMRNDINRQQHIAPNFDVAALRQLQQFNAMGGSYVSAGAAGANPLLAHRIQQAQVTQQQQMRGAPGTSVSTATTSTEGGDSGSSGTPNGESRKSSPTKASRSGSSGKSQVIELDGNDDKTTKRKRHRDADGSTSKKSSKKSRSAKKSDELLVQALQDLRTLYHLDPEHPPLSTVSVTKDDSIDSSSTLSGSYVRGVFENNPEMMKCLVGKSDAEIKAAIRIQILDHLQVKELLKARHPSPGVVAKNVEKKADKEAKSSQLEEAKKEKKSDDMMDTGAKNEKQGEALKDSKEAQENPEQEPKANGASASNGNKESTSNVNKESASKEGAVKVTTGDKASQGRTFTVTLHDIDHIVTTLVQERKRSMKQAVRKSVQLAYVEMKNRHDMILSEEESEWKKAQKKKLLSPTVGSGSSADMEALKEKHAAQLVALQSEHESFVSELVDQHEKQEQETKQQIATQKVLHSRMLENCLLASSSALKVVRDKVAAELLM